MMRDILHELLKQSNPFPILKITGTDDTTQVNACSDCKTFIFRAFLKKPIGEFKGEFGITNLSLLSGLLNFNAYRTDEATFNIKRRKIGDAEIVEQLELAAGKNSKSNAIFRFTAPSLVPEIFNMTGNPTFDVEFTPDRAKITEFQQLASLYSDVGKTFTPLTDGTDLVFHVGNKTSSTHSGSIVVQEGVTGSLEGEVQYPLAMFSQVMKLAGNNDTKISLKSRSGPMKITVETEHATYEYIIRASR